MSLRGNERGGGGGVGNNNNRGRRGGGTTTSSNSGRVYEGKGGSRSKGGNVGETSSALVKSTPLNSPNPHGPVKILQSRRNEEIETKISTTPAGGVIPTILQSASSSNVPRIAARPKNETEEKQQQSGPTSLPPSMPASIKFIDDSNNLNKGFLDYLTALNSNFNIVAIIGGQGSGKSTFASMLSGNEMSDLYGEYIFRPSPREFVEKGASQTTSINVYVTKTRTIVLDCQAINSGHIFELAHRNSRREGIKLSQVVKYYEDETHKLLMLLFEICHTIILGIDWFIDINIIREIMSADLSHRKLKSNYSGSSSVRKINLVVAQLRSRSADFQPEIVAERAKIIKGMFDGTRFDVCGGLSMKKLGFDMYAYAEPMVNYVIFAEIKPRSKLEQATIDDNYGLLTIPFTDIIDKFSLNLLSLPRPSFHQHQQQQQHQTTTTTTTGKMNEREWFQNMASPSWEKLLSSELTTFTRK